MAHLRREIKQQKYHEQADICATRATYRQGRKDTAVKVYTINLESKYLLIQGVPAIGIKQELEDLCGEYGAVLDLHALDEYPAEEYTEVYYVKYQNIQDAKIAKKKLDNRSFFGGPLHVCYAPEFESVQDVREKLQGRRKFIAARTRGKKISNERIKDYSNQYSAASSNHLPTTVPQVQPCPAPVETTSYVWAGKSCTVEELHPAISTLAAEESFPSQSICKKDAESSIQSKEDSFVPRQLKRNLDSQPKKPISRKSFFSGLYSDNSSSWRNTTRVAQDIPSDDADGSVSASIRAKLMSVGVPSLDVSLKRRRKQ